MRDESEGEDEKGEFVKKHPLIWRSKNKSDASNLVLTSKWVPTTIPCHGCLHMHIYHSLKRQCIVFVFVMKPLKFYLSHEFWAKNKAPHVIKMPPVE